MKKTVLITGASSGFGKATAELFAAAYMRTHFGPKLPLDR